MSVRCARLAALLASAGCASGDVVVVVTTDLRVPDQLDRIEVRVETDDDARTTLGDRETAVARDSALPVTVRLVSRGAVHADQRAWVTVVGFASGVRVVERRARVSLVAGRSSYEAVFLSQRCAGDLVCAAPDRTCTEAGCAAVDGVAPAPSRAAATCAPGQGDCDGVAANGCEADLRSDANHCGACGHACASCTEGVCDDGRVREVSAGATHTCAIRSMDRAVFCWGDNAQGQSTGRLADGAIVPPTRVVLPDVAQSLAAGGDHTCAMIGSSNRVVCWGGCTLAGCAFDPGTAVDLPAGTLSIASSLTATCAATATQVACWGQNAAGELGVPIGTHQALPSAPVVFTLPGSNVRIRSLGAGYRHMLAATSVGLYCWGQSGNDKCVPGVTNIAPPTRIPVGTPSMDASQPTGGLNHSCALVASGAIECWGANATEQLGQGLTMSSHDASDAVAVMGLTEAVSRLDTGGQHGCAIVGAAATLACWGRNTEDESAPGVDLQRVGTARTMPGLAGVTDVSCGGLDVVSTGGAAETAQGHTCVVLARGDVACWGDDSRGQVTGLGAAGTSGALPTLVPLPP